MCDPHREVSGRIFTKLLKLILYSLLYVSCTVQLLLQQACIFLQKDNKAIAKEENIAFDSLISQRSSQPGSSEDHLQCESSIMAHSALGMQRMSPTHCSSEQTRDTPTDRAPVRDKEKRTWYVGPSAYLCVKGQAWNHVHGSQTLKRRADATDKTAFLAHCFLGPSLAALGTGTEQSLR